MIVVSHLVFDINGAIEFEEDQALTNFGKKSRRQNRIATLDGGAVLQDRGFSVSDLTFKITAKVFTDEVFDRLRSTIVTEPEVRLSCREGIFIGAIKNLSFEDKRFEFLVTGDG